MPSTSRRPSVFTATATMTAIETIRWFSCSFTYAASGQRKGQSPSKGRFRNACTRSSISSQCRDTWLFEVPVSPMARTRSSTARVETPWI